MIECSIHNTISPSWRIFFFLIFFFCLCRRILLIQALPNPSTESSLAPPPQEASLKSPPAAPRLSCCPTRPRPPGAKWRRRWRTWGPRPCPAARRGLCSTPTCRRPPLWSRPRRTGCQRTSSADLMWERDETMCSKRGTLCAHLPWEKIKRFKPGVSPTEALYKSQIKINHFVPASLSL